MVVKERMDKDLPTDYTEEIYEAMERYFGQNQGTNRADMIIDMSAADPRTFGESHVYASLDSHLRAIVIAPLIEITKICRKESYIVLKNTDILGSLIKNNKTIISYLKLAEEGQMNFHERYCSMFE